MRFISDHAPDRVSQLLDCLSLLMFAHGQVPIFDEVLVQASEPARLRLKSSLILCRLAQFLVDDIGRYAGHSKLFLDQI